MRGLRTSILMVALVAMPTVASAQQANLLLLIAGNDTISRERVLRTPGRMELQLLSQAVGSRFRLTVTTNADQIPTRLTASFWQITDADDAPAGQTVTFEFRGDSVIAEVPGRETQRIGTERGAIPFINPSFALVELVLARAAVIGGDSVSVPVFLIQGGQTMPVTVVRLGHDSVRVGLGPTMALLHVDVAQRILGGTVPSQGLRIVRAREDAASMTAVRPDYSAPPGAPYEAIEVRIPTPMGHVLAGTLTLPRGAGPDRRVPAMVTSTGSGAQERDERVLGVTGYALFRQVADTLSRHGIAVLRMDDRGQGGSGGQWAGATTADFADDVRAGLAWLRQHPAIDATRLGVIGHSEGGIVAPMVAATDTTLRAIVLLAGPSRLGRRVVQFQQRQVIDAVPGITAAQRDSIFAAAQVTLDSVASLDPWLRYFLALDPLPLAAKIQRPAVLIVQGATDLQVTADQAPEWEAAFKAAGNRDVTMRVFAEANHLLVQDPVGHPGGYATLPSKAVRPDILGAVLTWLQARMGGR